MSHISNQRLDSFQRYRFTTTKRTGMTLPGVGYYFILLYIYIFSCTLFSKIVGNDFLYFKFYCSGINVDILHLKKARVVLHIQQSWMIRPYPLDKIHQIHSSIGVNCQ